MNLFLFLVLVIAALSFDLKLITLSSSLPPIKCKGNSTDDPEISYKYQPSSIPTNKLLLTIILLPLFEFILVEFLITEEPENVRKRFQSESRLKRATLMGFQWYFHYFLGLMFLVVLTGAGKIIARRPRPHWVDVCQPKFYEEDCDHGVVYNYNCTNPKLNPWKIREGYESFFSGHTALSTYLAMCMILYQANRLGARRWGSAVIVFLHALWCSGALYCAFSRLSEYHHHLEDVAVGVLAGLAMSWFVVTELSGNFDSLHRREEQNYRLKCLTSEPAISLKEDSLMEMV